MPSRNPPQDPIPTVAITPAARVQQGIQTARLPRGGDSRIFDNFSTLGSIATILGARKVKNDRIAEEEQAAGKAAKDFEPQKKADGTLETQEEIFARNGRRINANAVGDTKRLSPYLRESGKLEAASAATLVYTRLAVQGDKILSSMYDDSGLRIKTEAEAVAEFDETLTKIDAEIREMAGGALSHPAAGSEYVRSLLEIRSRGQADFIEAFRALRDVEIQKLAKEKVFSAYQNGGIDAVNEVLSSTYAGGVGGPPAESRKKEIESIKHLVASVEGQLQTDPDSGAVYSSPEKAIQLIEELKLKGRVGGARIKEGSPFDTELNFELVRLENEYSKREDIISKALLKNSQVDSIRVTDLIAEVRAENDFNISREKLEAEVTKRILQDERYTGIGKDARRARVLDELHDQSVRKAQLDVTATKLEIEGQSLSVEREFSQLRTELSLHSIDDARRNEIRAELVRLANDPSIDSKLAKEITEFFTAGADKVQQVRELPQSDTFFAETKRFSDIFLGIGSEAATQAALQAEEETSDFIVGLAGTLSPETGAEISAATPDARRRLQLKYDELRTKRAEAQQAGRDLIRTHAKSIDLDPELAKYLTAEDRQKFNEELEGVRDLEDRSAEFVERKLFQKLSQLTTPGAPTSSGLPGVSATPGSSIAGEALNFPFEESPGFTERFQNEFVPLVQELANAVKDWDGTGTFKEYVKQVENEGVDRLREELLLVKSDIESRKAVVEESKELGELRRGLAEVSSAVTTFNGENGSPRDFVLTLNSIGPALPENSRFVKQFQNLTESNKALGPKPGPSYRRYLVSISDSILSGDEDSAAKAASLYGVSPFSRTVRVPVLPDAEGFVKYIKEQTAKENRNNAPFVSRTTTSVEALLDKVQSYGLTGISDLFEQVPTEHAVPFRKYLDTYLERFLKEETYETRELDVKGSISPGTVFNWNSFSRTTESTQSNLEALSRLRKEYYRAFPPTGESKVKPTFEVEQLKETFELLNLKDPQDINRFFDTAEQITATYGLTPRTN